MLLLLDGLDEVALERREKCVEAINEFRQKHLVPLVVCSRVADYEALDIQLKLQSAVLLQPLTSQQVNDYLNRAGPEFAAVHEALKKDPILQELAQSPLMLSIMTLAYRGISVEDLQPLGTTEGRRKHLFDTYVQQMFKHRTTDKCYSQKKTIHWLSWLAQKMSQHAHTVFLIERMQPNWLQTYAQRRLYAVSVVVIAGLFIGLAAGLISGLFFALVSGLVIGLAAGLVIGGVSLAVTVLVTVLVIGLASWLASWLAAGLSDKSRDIKTVEVLKWRLEGKGLFSGLVIGLVSVLVSGLLSGLVFGLFFGLFFGLVGLFSGLVIGLVFGLFIGLAAGLKTEEIETKTVSNQGIRQSAKNAVILGLLTGLVIGLAAGLVIGLAAGLVIGLAAGLVIGLIFGGFAFIQHYVLRFILYRNGHIPWNYARFLDYAAERIFLRKVGGGYIFVHRLLMDYFTSVGPEQEGG